MQEQIQSIPTHYNGCTFRSRLEAQWAVYFKNIGWNFQYEPQYFTIDASTKYLPDFYLPKFNLYIEIKPANFTATLVDLQKYRSTCAQTNSLFLVCCGRPWCIEKRLIFSSINNRCTQHLSLFKAFDGFIPKSELYCLMPNVAIDLPAKELDSDSQLKIFEAMNEACFAKF